MTEYVVYKSRGDSWVELYRCSDRADTEKYFHNKLGGKALTKFEMHGNEVSFTTSDGAVYTYAEEVEGWL